MRLKFITMGAFSCDIFYEWSLFNPLGSFMTRIEIKGVTLDLLF